MTKLFGAVEAVAKASLRRFASFDGELFFEVCAEPALQLQRQLDPSEGALMTGYLEMIADGVGAGLLSRLEGPRAPAAPSEAARRAFERVMLKLVPEQLGSIEPAKRGEALVSTFNILDGAVREGRWLGEWLCARFLGLTELSQLEAVTERELAQLEPPRPRRFEPPFRVTCFDPRPIVSDFLPGSLHLAAPHVACIHDRRRSAGLALCAGALPSLSSGPTACLGRSGEAPATVQVEAHQRGVVIAGHEISFPLGGLGELLVGHGYLVVTSESSQRVWLLEGAR
ncbi:MAG: hypothetical protein HYV07_31595 [Deltaproteobacteria bacterium]|nr:hypothetical protein [Deltaproteobacteria bacterium]